MQAANQMAIRDPGIHGVDPTTITIKDTCVHVYVYTYVERER